MTKTYTPGPWTAVKNDHGDHYIRPNRQKDGGLSGFVVAHVPDDRDGGLERMMGGTPGANAQLIAAAPDLLAALKEISHALYARQEAAGMAPGDVDLCNIADAAVARAERKPL